MKTLGDGNFAVVKQARQKSTDHEYAIKVIDKSKMKVNFMNLENVLKNIKKFYSSFF